MPGRPADEVPMKLSFYFNWQAGNLAYDWIGTIFPPEPGILIGPGNLTRLKGVLLRDTRKAGITDIIFARFDTLTEERQVVPLRCPYTRTIHCVAAPLRVSHSTMSHRTVETG